MFQMCLIVVFYFYFPADVVFPGQGAMDSPGSNVGITVVFDAAPVITHAPSGDVRGSAAPIFDKGGIVQVSCDSGWSWFGWVGVIMVTISPMGMMRRVMLRSWISAQSDSKMVDFSLECQGVTKTKKDNLYP